MIEILPTPKKCIGPDKDPRDKWKGHDEEEGINDIEILLKTIDHFVQGDFRREQGVFLKPVLPGNEKF